MLFFYIRHADPIYSPDSLTKQGELQASALAKRLALYGIDKIYASTSNRAQMTARPTADLLNKEVELLDFAKEGYAWGEFTIEIEPGKRQWFFQNQGVKELFHSDEVIALGEEWYKHPGFASCSSKSGLDRIGTASDELFESLGYRHLGNGRYQVVNKTDERIALFAHQGFGLAFLSHVLGIPYPMFASHFDIGHSGMTVIEFRDDGGYSYPKVLTLSNDAHLLREGLPTKYNNRIYF